MYTHMETSYLTGDPARPDRVRKLSRDNKVLYERQRKLSRDNFRCLSYNMRQRDNETTRQHNASNSII